MKSEREDKLVPKDFFEAIESDDTQGLALLLSMNGDVNVTNEDNFTALHIAAVYGMTEAIAQLLTRENLEIDAKTDWDRGDIDNATALDIAAHCGHALVARQLLEAKASITYSDSENNNLSTLEMAVAYDRPGVVKVLLDAKALSNQPDGSREDRSLHYALVEGTSPTIVKYLLDAKANMGLKNSVGKTPLDHLSRNLSYIQHHLQNNLAKLYWLQQAMQTNRAIAILMGLHARVGVRSPVTQVARHRRNLFDPQVLRLVLVMMGVNSRKRRIQFCIAFLMGFHPRAGGVEPLQEVPSVLQAVSRHTLFKPEMLRLPLQLGGAIPSRGLR